MNRPVNGLARRESRPAVVVDARAAFNSKPLARNRLAVERSGERIQIAFDIAKYAVTGTIAQLQHLLLVFMGSEI
jgi:hypothetical protein